MKSISCESLSIMQKAFKKVFSEKKNILYFSFVFILLSFLIIGFQYYIYGSLFVLFFTITDFILLFLLICEITLLITYQIYNIKHNLKGNKNSSFGYLALIPTFLIACPSCLIGTIGIFSFASIGFLNSLETLTTYKTGLITALIILELIPLYYLSKKLAGYCIECEINSNKNCKIKK